jgi:hypothetical protein
MVGSSSQSTPLQVLGVLAALVGLVGYVVFDWRFTQSDGRFIGASNPGIEAGARPVAASDGEETAER